MARSRQHMQGSDVVSSMIWPAKLVLISGDVLGHCKPSDQSLVEQSKGGSSDSI